MLICPLCKKQEGIIEMLRKELIELRARIKRTDIRQCHCCSDVATVLDILVQDN